MSNQMIISPIRLVEYMYKEFPLIFAELCGTKRLEQFWTSIPADDPKLISHPWFTLTIGKRAIPIMIHGDYGKFTHNNQNSLMVASWRPLLNTNLDFGSLLLFFCFT